jgi:hypothetical protein
VRKTVSSRARQPVVDDKFRENLQYRCRFSLKLSSVSRPWRFLAQGDNLVRSRPVLVGVSVAG